MLHDRRGLPVSTGSAELVDAIERFTLEVLSHGKGAAAILDAVALDPAARSRTPAAPRCTCSCRPPRAGHAPRRGSHERSARRRSRTLENASVCSLRRWMPGRTVRRTRRSHCTGRSRSAGRATC